MKLLQSMRRKMSLFGYGLWVMDLDSIHQFKGFFDAIVDGNTT